MKRILVILLVIAVTLNVVGFYYFTRPKENKDELFLYGNVDVRQVDIGFRVAGQVEKLAFEEGDKVCKGALMTVLDKTPYDNQVRQAAANVDAIIASLVNAEKLFKRRLELIKVGGVSQEDLDTAKANFDQLQANLVGAKAALAVAKDNLNYTEAYAPTDGVVLTRIREPGTVVNPSDPVYTLSVVSPVWVRAYVSEKNLGQVYYGMPAEIYTDIENGPVYKGEVGFISPVAEFTPKTVETTELRTDLVYRLRIYADNPDRGLIQGMPVTVKLTLGSKKSG
jgi:HlyD family secretion protein